MKPGATKHHEEAKSTRLSFAKDVKSLISAIDDMGNPFTDESEGYRMVLFNLGLD